MSVVEFEFDRGDEKIGHQFTDKFQGKEGETYRISFAWWRKTPDGNPDFSAPSPRFIVGKRHFIPNVGYVLDGGPEFQKLSGNRPKDVIATIIVIWPMGPGGDIDKARFAEGKCEVKAWTFSSDKYDVLKRRNREFPLNNHDLLLACQDTQYQKMDMTPCKTSALRSAFASKSEAMRKMVASIVEKVAEIEKVLPDTIGRPLTIDQVREKLGGAPIPPIGTDESIASNVDDILDDLAEV